MAGKLQEQREASEARDRQMEQRLCRDLGLPWLDESAGSPEAESTARARLAALAEAVRRHLDAGSGDDVPPYKEVIDEVLDSVLSANDDRSEAERGLSLELDGWFAGRWQAATMVDFLRILACRALMPAVWIKSWGHFKRKDVPIADREDLSCRVVVKLLSVMKNGRAPYGNFGAYVGKTQPSVWCDYLRRLRRTRARFASASDAVERAQSNESFAKWSMLTSRINGLPPMPREIFKRRLEVGQTWPQVAEALGITARTALRLAEAAWRDHFSDEA